MNRLPKYWVVKNDGSQKFKDTVIAYMNTIYDCWTGTSRKYYGYDGSEDYGGTNVFNNIKDFQNNPTLLTIEQFIEMTKEETAIETNSNSIKIEKMIEEKEIEIDDINKKIVSLINERDKISIHIENKQQTRRDLERDIKKLKELL